MTCYGIGMLLCLILPCRSLRVCAPHSMPSRCAQRRGLARGHCRARLRRCWSRRCIRRSHAGEVVRVVVPWVPHSDSNSICAWTATHGCSRMLVAVMGVLVVLYARYYMSPADPVPRFFAFLLAFTGSMLGIVLSGNLIQLVVFWELTSLTSFMLIAYWYHREEARRGARMALIVTAAGGMCLLLGVSDAREHRRRLRPRSRARRGRRIRAHPLVPARAGYSSWSGR